MRTSIVIGLCFGDEGKGLTTSFLSKENDLVVRFNGGHQAGHTVEKNGYRHVFSTFGAGTLNGSHTYISQYCTFYPIACAKEQEALIQNGFSPILFVHPLAMITTPFDVDFNQQSETKNNHGSVGVGFGATIARNENTPFKLFAVDLTYKEILLSKLHQIANYYKSEFVEEKIKIFLAAIDKINVSIKTISEIKYNYENIVFEGAQGIMLDMDFGFFPNVTRSNTTSKKAMEIIKSEHLPKPEIYYCMRAYLTRHGNGFIPNETQLNFEDKTNITHQYQGKFRQGFHSLEMLKYAIKCDSCFSGNENKNLSIICLDQTENKIFLDKEKISVEEFKERIGIDFSKTLTNEELPINENNFKSLNG